MSLKPVAIDTFKEGYQEFCPDRAGRKTFTPEEIAEMEAFWAAERERRKVRDSSKPWWRR
jgi:hypothetical protein